MANRAHHSERHPGVELCGTASVDPADLAKVEVFAFLSQLAETGQATLSPLATGEIEVRFLSGEAFLLGKTTITRLN